MELEGFTQTQPEHYKIELEKVLSRADIPVNKLKKDGELIPLECTKIANRDGVTMLLLNNEKNTIYQEGKDNRTLTYHPGCYIFIDNRKGASTMAIERSSSFESKPDKVRDLLEEAFNKILKDKGMKVEIRARLREAGFWDIVDEQCKKFNDVVRKVSFTFPNPDEVKNIPEDINSIEFTNPSLFSYVDRVEIGRVVNDYRKYHNIKEEKPNVIILTFPNSEVNTNVIMKLLNPSFNYEKLSKYKRLFSDNVIFSTSLKLSTVEKIVPPFITHKFDRTLWFGEFSST